MNRNERIRGPKLILAVMCLSTLSACDDDDGGYGGEPLFPLDAAVLTPPDNPITDAKADLGELLFFDPVLSTDGDVACATCHLPAFAYADGRALAVGVGGTGEGPARIPGAEFPNAGRNAPTLLNVAFNGLTEPGSSYDPANAPMFWDHRIRGLEAQVLDPIRTPSEMLGSAVQPENAVQAAVDRINAISEYVDRFDDVFGPGGADETRLSHALATYVRTLVVRDSPFDRFMRGDTAALTAQQQRGMDVFEDADCAGCHNGPMLSDWSLKRLGVGPHPDGPMSDTGAGDFRFRSASLRNVELTGPYMHDGSIGTLEEVIAYYATAESVHPGVSSIDIESQSMSASDRLALLSFLEALTDTGFDTTNPPSVPSGLPVPGAGTP